LDFLVFPWILSSESILINGLHGINAASFFLTLLPAGGPSLGVLIVCMLGGKHGSRAMSATYKIEYMKGGERIKTVELTEEQWDEAIELAQDGMQQYGANFARILNHDGAEVWSGRSGAERS
jgi:hypothetical protein